MRINEYNKYVLLWDVARHTVTTMQLTHRFKFN